MLHKQISQLSSKKEKQFREAFENAEEVYVDFILSRTLDQLYGQPAIGLAGTFFMSRALGDTDLDMESAKRMFVVHQKNQLGHSPIEENDCFEYWFEKLCDYKIQKLEPRINPDPKLACNF